MLNRLPSLFPRRRQAPCQKHLFHKIITIPMAVIKIPPNLLLLRKKEDYHIWYKSDKDHLEQSKKMPSGFKYPQTYMPGLLDSLETGLFIGYTQHKDFLENFYDRSQSIETATSAAFDQFRSLVDMFTQAQIKKTLKTEQFISNFPKSPAAS